MQLNIQISYKGDSKETTLTLYIKKQNYKNYNC